MDFHECDIKTKDHEGKHWQAGLRHSLKGFVHQRILSREWKDNPQNVRKYSQGIYPILDEYQEYIQNLYNSTITKQTPNIKMAKGFE